MVKQVVSTIISVLKEQVEVADVMMKNEKGSLKLNYANGKEYWVEVGSDRMFFYNEALSDYKHDIINKIKEWEALLDK